MVRTHVHGIPWISKNTLKFSTQWAHLNTTEQQGFWHVAHVAASNIIKSFNSFMCFPKGVKQSPKHFCAFDFPHCVESMLDCCQIYNIRHTKSQKIHVSSCSCLCPIHWSVENEDVVGAAPTGNAPTTSEWSTTLLPTKVRLILDV